MSKIEETFGTLLFIRKNGEPGTSYHLSAGKTIIGTSTEATIRIKRNELLEGIHCIVDVTDDGIATVVNKSTATPISVNTVTIRKFKVLSNKDTIDIAGKQFIYINDNLSMQKVEKYRTALKNIISTPTKRQSVAPILKVRSSKKTPNVRSITPIQKKPLSRTSFRSLDTGPMTPNRKPDRKDVEKCQTMSKLIGHKSVLPKGFKKRRLSLDSHIKPDKGKKVSERNILLSENIEEDPVPTLSLQKDGDKAADFTVLSNTSSSSEEGVDNKRRSMRAPSRASVTEVAPIKGTPKNTPLAKSKTPFTPIEDKIRKSVLEKGSLTGNRDKTPVFARRSKNLRGETPKTPIPKTPINKRLELLKGTPSSSRRSKSLESVAKSNENRVEIESPILSNSKKNDDASVRECITPTTGTQIFRSEISDKKKRRRNSVDHTTLPEKSFQKRRKTEGGRPNEDVFFGFTSKKIPVMLSDSPISRRSRISTIDSGNLSDGSVNLNISTGSSISPIPRDVLSSVDSDIPDKQSVETRRSSRKSQRAKEECNGDFSARSNVNDSNLRTSQSLRENLQNNEDENQESSSEGSEKSCQEMSRNNLDNSKLRKSLINQFPNSLKNNEEYGDSSKGLEKSRQNTSENKMDESKLRKSQRMQKSVRESVKNNEDQDTSSSTESSENSPRQETSRKSLNDSNLRNSLENSQQMERSVRNKKNDYSFESLEKSPQRKVSRVSLQDSKLRKSLRNSQKLNKSLQNSLEIKDGEDQDSSFESSEKSVEEELSRSNLKNSTSLKEGEEKSLSRSRRRNNSPDKVEKKEKRSSSEDSEVANLFRRKRGLGNKETLYHSSPIALNIQDTPKDSVESNDEEKEESSIDVSLLSSTSEDEKEADKSKEHLRRSDRVNRKDVSFTSDDSDIKPIFIPQRRPPIKRSYGNDKELSVHLSNTPERQSEGFNRENDLSTISNRSARSSSRRSISKRCKSCDVSPASRLSTKETSTRNLNDSVSRDSDSVLLDNSFGRVTPRKSLLANKSQSEGESSDLESLTSIKLNKSYKSPPKNLSVISVKDDSVKSTPENNTSIIILDTPLELTGKNSRKKLSKTLNSSIEDCELTTPKSAIKSRRSMSLPYKPIVEEITPVTPEEGVRKGETSFKTPMNTPGLFENIKNSVLKSRSRKTGNLMEELNRAEVNKAEKRPRESTGSVGRSTKKRKVMDEDLAYDSVNEDLDASFASFATDEVFADIADQYVAPTTPTGFSNLTDKPVITDPQQRSLSEPRAKRSAPKRRSLHAMKFESKSSDSDKEMNSSISTSDTTVDTSCSSTDLFDDSSVGSRRSSRRLSVKEDARNKRQMAPPKSPKNDLSDVRGIKRLLATPKTITSPKNDLTNIIGVKKLLSTPKVGKSPKNDLTKVPNLRTLVYPVPNSPKNDLSDVAGVKKLLGTPKVVKSPKNDLRNIPNLRKIMSPRRQNSPTNDLRNIIGVKKLLATPKKQNSPKNDLSKVPNLHRVMSPKQQNEPKNDLTKVVGVKKLFSTPKKQNSPRNDLTKVPNLQKMMYPKQQNSPRNDLADVDGVADLFAEQENNSDLFDKLFVKKPIRTYRGRSMSPITRKAMLYGENDRKTLGDKPYSSPRIEKWLEEQVSRTNQAVVKLERMNDEDLRPQTVQEETSPKSKRVKKNDMDAGVSQVEKRPRNRRGAPQIDNVEVTESPRSMRLRQKRIVQDNSLTGTTPELKPPQPKRGRLRKNSQKDGTSPDEEIQNLEELKPVPIRRGRPRKQSKKDDEESSETDQDKENVLEQVKSAPIRRGRANIPSKKYEEEKVVVPPRGRPRSLSCDEALLITKPSPRGRRAVKKDLDEVHEEVAPPPRRRGKKIEEEKVVEEDVTPQVKRRGKGKAAVNEESDDSKEQKPNNKGRKTPNIEEDIVSNDEEIPQTRRRGRAKAASSEESVDSVEQKVNRRGRRAPKIEVGEVEVTPQQNTKTSPDYESVDDADGKVNSRGRKLPKKDEEDTKNEEMPKKRGRKNVVTEAEDTPNENKEVKEPVKRRGRKKVEEETPKAEDKDNIDIEENKEKPVKKRGGRRKVEVEEKEEPLKEASNINKELTVTLTPEKIEVVKRGGRRKIVAEPSDEISKEENKENEQGKSKHKKQPAKGKNDTKKMDLEEEISDSPRSTRQKKGNFKKYGNDFLIEEGGGKMKKTVRFEDTEDSSGKNKRKGKVAEQTEEVENEVRRSKRTRK